MKKNDGFSIQSIIENALQYRFSEKEPWKNPSFLAKKFSLDILEKAIGHISNKQRLFSTDPSSPYKTDTIKEAKNLLKEANEILGNLKEVGSKEFKEDKNIILQKDSSTPESFYQELMEESFVRRLLSKKSNENKEKY